MDVQSQMQPLSHKSRQRTFFALVAVFLISLPFLYLYATGYRLDYRKPTSLVSTGGIYVAVDMSDADIYIDNELVRETRTFRKAFYAQNLDVGTHRLHVQKEGYHTWVKELPVSKRLVTEAEAFNLPIIPQVRVISRWQTATGSAVVREVLLHASSTNELVATTTPRTNLFTENEEYTVLIRNFSTTSATTSRSSTRGVVQNLLRPEPVATTSEATTTATSTIATSDVLLARQGDELFARWVGEFEEMPYYYCAPEFPAYTGSTSPIVAEELELFTEQEDELEDEEAIVIHPIQTVSSDIACDPTIRIDRRGEEIHDFDFFPGSSDLVILALGSGIYVVEVDDRAWQNMQPLFMGENLRMHIENGNIFVYDGELIYQVIISNE